MVRRLGAIGIAAAALFAAALLLLSGLESRAPSASASESVAPPGPPTFATITPEAGHTALVAWGTPLSDGGSPIQFYRVTTYNGKHSCTAPSPGSNSCVVTGLVGNRYSVRVRAVNAAGRSPPTKATATHVLSTNSNGPAPAGTAPATSPATSQSPGSGLTADGAPSTETATDATPTDASPDTLPFTGFNVETLLAAGVGLLFAGLLLSDAGSQRRRRVGGFWHWLFGI